MSEENKIGTTPEAKPDLEALLQENLRYMKVVYADTQKIRKHMFWQSMINWLWVILFIAPLVAGLIFLPGLLSGGLSGITGGANINDMMNILK